jgi:hypothetical protein
LAEVGSAAIDPTEVRAAEDRPAEIRPSEVRFDEVCLAEVKFFVLMLLTPSGDCLSAFEDDFDMLWIRHLSTPKKRRRLTPLNPVAHSVRCLDSS